MIFLLNNAKRMTHVIQYQIFVWRQGSISVQILKVLKNKTSITFLDQIIYSKCYAKDRDIIVVINL